LSHTTSGDATGDVDEVADAVLTTMVTAYAPADPVQRRASPQVVRLAVIVACPGARARKVAVTMPQPIPGRQTEGAAPEAVGPETRATTAGSELGWMIQ
jgi:hypothetical protein